MKTIALMPVRNEAPILPFALQCLEAFCDHIFIADQDSTDETCNVARGHPSVTLLANTAPVGKGFRHGRNVLLDAFRSFDGTNIGLCLDADELVSPTIFKNLAGSMRAQCRRGDVVSFQWVQLWRNFHRYRNDASVWSNSWKPMAFWDDRSMSYPTGSFLHEARVPAGVRQPVPLQGFPVLHLQWALWDRTQYKQAWYRALEFIEGGFTDAASINSKYAITLGDSSEVTSAVPQAWSEGVGFPPETLAALPGWHRDEMLRFFSQHGIAAFEPLQIWHIAEFRTAFVEKIGRAPVSHVHCATVSPIGRVIRGIVPGVMRKVMRRIIRRHAT